MTARGPVRCVGAMSEGAWVASLAPAWRAGRAMSAAVARRRYGAVVAGQGIAMSAAARSSPARGLR